MAAPEFCLSDHFFVWILKSEECKAPRTGTTRKAHRHPCEPQGKGAWSFVLDSKWCAASGWDSKHGVQRWPPGRLPAPCPGAEGKEGDFPVWVLVPPTFIPSRISVSLLFCFILFFGGRHIRSTQKICSVTLFHKAWALRKCDDFNQQSSYSLW